MEITGKVIQILPEQTGVKKDGSSWLKQDFVIETNDKYPKKVCITTFEDKVPIPPVGKEIEVSINLESREYNERWYTEVRAWKIVVKG